MSAVEAGGGRTRRRLRPRLPPLRGPARRAGGGDERPVQGVDPPGPRAAPVVAPEGRPVRPARRRDDPGHHQRRHRLRDAQPGHRPRRDRHLPRLRRRVVGAAAVRRPRRSRRGLPRPPPARAAADVRPPADRGRLRGRQGRGDRHDPVRLLVPPPGRAVRRQHARQRQRTRLLPRPPRRAVEGPAGGRPAGRVLRRDRRRHLVADRPPHRRRGCGHRAVPRDVDRLGHPRRRRAADGSIAAAAQRAGPAAVPARHRLPRPHRSDVAARRGRQRRRARRCRLRRRAGRRAPPCCCGATGGWSDERAAASSSDMATRRSSTIPRSRSPTSRCGSGRRSRCPS